MALVWIGLFKIQDLIFNCWNFSNAEYDPVIIFWITADLNKASLLFNFDFNDWFIKISSRGPPGFCKFASTWELVEGMLSEVGSGVRVDKKEKPAFAIPKAPFDSNWLTYSCTSLSANQSSRSTICTSTSLNPTKTSFLSQLRQ